MNAPIPYAAVSLCLGIAASSYIKVPVIYPLISVFVFTAISFLSLKYRVVSFISLCLGVFFLGIFTYQASNILPQGHISALTSAEGERISLRGEIIDDPIMSRTFYGQDKIDFTLNVRSFKRESLWQASCGRVLVNAYSRRFKKRFGYGDEILLVGVISRPHGLRNPGLFDYSEYLGSKNIYSIFKVKDKDAIELTGRNRANYVKIIAYAMRQKIRGAIDGHFSQKQPDNGFLKAILIGDRIALKKPIEEDFIKTGTVHILSVSGTHVGLIACVILFILACAGMPKKAGMLITLICLVFYSFMAGFSPPIVRSTIMYSIFAIGFCLDRDSDVLNNLSLAGLLMLLCDPKELYDPGFQLSFASVASIAILSPKIDNIFTADIFKRRPVNTKVKVYVTKSIAVSIAAWAGVAPIVSYYFNITSPIAIVANLLVIPMISAVMVLSFIFLGMSFITGIFTVPLVSMIHAADQAVFFINNFLAQIRFGYFRTPSPSLAGVAVYYGALAIFMASKVPERRVRVLIVTLISLNMLIWGYGLKPERHILKAVFFDVGKGDSIFIEFPKKGNLLIDGGPGRPEDGYSAGRSVIAPYLWSKGIKHIDAVMASHFHEDHVGGLIYILRNFEIGCVMDNGSIAVHRNGLRDIYEKVISEKHIRHFTVREGDKIAGYGGAKLLVLGPADTTKANSENENSIILKLCYNGYSFLFCGDTYGKGLTYLNSYKKFLQSDVLKSPHHGGAIGGLKQAKIFFENAAPKIMVKNGGAMSVVIDGKMLKSGAFDSKI